MMRILLKLAQKLGKVDMTDVLTQSSGDDLLSLLKELML